MNRSLVDNHRPSVRLELASRCGRKALGRDNFSAEPLT